LTAARVPDETVLRSVDGRILPLNPARWFGGLPPEEDEVLAEAVAPVLDAGCGPGRHVVALSRRGVFSVGVDVAPSAVGLVRRRGAIALRASIFDYLPWTGTWGSVLLLDGNVGIGGDPERLIRRVRSLLRRGGRVLLELEPPGVPSRSLRVRLEAGGLAGPWFRWGVLGMDGLARVARSGGFVVAKTWTGGGRWFGRLDAR
jgi:SAM-dependent methyltransferase